MLIALGWAPGILGGALMRLRSEWDSSARRGATQTDAILLMGKLKSLPRVLEIITGWASSRRMDDPRGLAKAVTAHWIDCLCHHCHGRGKDVIAGTPFLGRQCKHCNGTGKRPEPRGEPGRLALTLMEQCIYRSKQSIKSRLRQMR